MPVELVVIIVNHNSGPCLGRCVASLPHGLGDAAAWSAVVVDNASIDGSTEGLGRIGGRVDVLPTGGNLGFARAANLGASGRCADLLLFLNPDCRLEPGMLDPLLDDLRSGPRVAAVAPLVTNEDATPQGNARGDPGILTGLFGRTTPLRRWLPGWREARRNVVPPGAVPSGERGVDVDWAAGSCLLVRREAFVQVGGFDGGYFLYWEDADLCRRLRNAGWRIRFRPDAKVVHVGGQSSKQVPRLAIRAFHESAYRYYRTHVAPAPLDPRRWLAKAVLAARCQVLLAADRRRSQAAR